MENDLLTGIRNLRSSLLSGALLLASLYVILSGEFPGSVAIRDSARELLSFHDRMPLVLVATAAYIVGSLYITSLRGVVDWVQRLYIGTRTSASKGSRTAKYIEGTFCPLSEASSRRLRAYAEKYFEENCSELLSGQNEPRSEFVSSVFSDVLWMEGKLTGSLRAAHRDYLAEGEFRVGVGILLPLVAVSVAYSVLMSKMWIFFFLLASIAVAIQTIRHGLYYYRRAHSLLAHHVADSVILTPSMETLKT